MPKLSIGVYRGDADLVNEVVACAPDAVLLLEDALHLAVAIKALLPKIKIHGRKFLDAPEQLGRLHDANRAQITRDWLNQAMDQYPVVDNWMGYNEVAAGGQTDLLKMQVEAEIAGAAACADRGKGFICLNQAPGNEPTTDPADTARWWWPDWLAAIKPIFAARGVRYWGTHRYTSGKVRFDEPARDWYMLRDRKLLASLAAAGVSAPPIVITEYGHAGGWRGWLSEEHFAADLSWYGARLEETSGIHSAHYFLDGDCGGWEDYDIRGTAIPAAIGAWNRSAVPAGGGTVADYPGATVKNSPNFGYPRGTAGRAGHLVVAIVDHITAGSAAATDSWFMSPTSGASAHYVVRKDGVVVSYVRESNAAWTQGIDFAKGYDAYKSDLSIPWIADCWRDKVSPNLVAVGVEHEALAGESLTPAQLQASVALHKYLAGKYKFSLTERGRVVGHSAIDAVNRPNDPGPVLAQLVAGFTAPAKPVDVAAIRLHLDVLWGHKEVLRALNLPLGSPALKAIADAMEERIVGIKIAAGLQ